MKSFKNFLGSFFQHFAKKREPDANTNHNHQDPFQGETNTINYQLNEETMAKKTVITRVLDVETSDAIVEFPQNRTLLAEQLTDEAPVKPEIVKGLKTMDDIFNYYKPKVKLDFEGPDGQSKNETLHFNDLRDFEKDGLIKNSEFLKDIGLKRESYQKIEKQLRTNKLLRDAIADPEARVALIRSMQALLKELQNAD